MTPSLAYILAFLSTLLNHDVSLYIHPVQSQQEICHVHGPVSRISAD